MAGVIIADAIKGPLKGNLPSLIEAGIVFHRQTDAFVDQLPARRELLKLCPQHQRRIAPILIDLIDDYCISRRWQDYHQQDFSDWRQHSYEHLGQQFDQMPDVSQNFCLRLKQYDTLGQYHHQQTLLKACELIAMRFKRRTELQSAMQVMLKQETEIFEAFSLYYPQILSWAEKQRHQIFQS